MDNAWIPVIGTLSGVLIGGCIAYFSKRLELRLQQKIERSKIKLSKIEELHLLVSNFIEYTGNLQPILKRINSTKTTKPTAVDFIDDFGKSLSKIHSMISLYAPEAKESWSKFLSSTTQLQTKVNEFISKKDSLEDVNSQQEKANSDCETLLEHLERIANSLI